MKKEAVGDITRSGGFSRLVRDVEQHGEPIIIMKSNAPVAVVLPCPEGMESYIRDWMGVVRTFVDLIQEDRAVDGVEFLLKQVALGDAARGYLLVLGADLSSLRSATDAIQSGMVKVIRNYALEMVMKNSSEGSRSVPPMTTTSADVSEVKQEELPLGNSSLSRKRGRPKKQASSPPKRKIGTKREKSA